MTLIKSEEIIAYAKKSYNLFILDCAIPGKVIILKKKDKLTHLVNQNKKIRIWHQNFSHISNTKVVCISKLVNKIILDFQSKYNLKKY